MPDSNFEVAKSRPDLPTNAGEWYVIHAGKELGPLSLAELVELVVIGTVLPDDLVKPTGGTWTKAREIVFLAQEFLVKKGRERTIDQLGDFRGIWISKKALAFAGVVVLILVIVPSAVYVIKNLNTNEGVPAPPVAKPNAISPLVDPEILQFARSLSWYNRPKFKKFNRGPLKESGPLLNSARDHTRKREYDRAIVNLDAAIRLDPGYPESFFERGCDWMVKLDFDKANRDFDVALNLDPDETFHYAFRSACYVAKRDYDRAIKDCDEAIRLDPLAAPRGFYAVAFFCRAHAWAGKKEFDKAIQDFNAILQRDPSYASANVGRGMVWSAKGDHGKALEDFDKAIRTYEEMIRLGNDGIQNDAADLPMDLRDKEDLKHTVAGFYDGLAWLLATCNDVKVRDPKRAIQLARKACDLTGWKNGWEISTLAAAFAEAGQFDEAERNQRKALEDPMFEGPGADEFGRRLERYKQKLTCRAVVK